MSARAAERKPVRDCVQPKLDSMIAPCPCLSNPNPVAARPGDGTATPSRQGHWMAAARLAHKRVFRARAS